MNGTAQAADTKNEFVKLATRLLLEEAAEAEARDALGREYYRHGGGSRASQWLSPRAAENRRRVDRVFGAAGARAARLEEPGTRGAGRVGRGARAARH